MTSVSTPAQVGSAQEPTSRRPGRSLVAFAVLLVVLFGGSFAVGRLAGPLTPGSHRTTPGPATPTDMPGMQMDGLRLVSPLEVSR
jgi:hypothetical protein